MKLYQLQILHILFTISHGNSYFKEGKVKTNVRIKECEHVRTYILDYVQALIRSKKIISKGQGRVALKFLELGVQRRIHKCNLHT